ncbi:MAG: PEP-CTERM sorting domain-containing protein [Pirellulales bacterium]
MTCLFVATVAQPARAVLMAPGDSVLGSPEAKPDPLSVVVDTLTSPFSTSNYSGKVVSTVLSQDTTNALGGYTFVYELYNDAASVNVLERLSVLGFGGMQVDVSYNPIVPVSGVAPSIMDRSFGSGDTIGWQFVGPPLSPAGYLDPGDNSYLLVVQTGVRDYTRGVANVIDGVSTSVEALVPIPEPASLALAGLGALGVGLAVARSRRRR